MAFERPEREALLTAAALSGRGSSRARERAPCGASKPRPLKLGSAQFSGEEGVLRFAVDGALIVRELGQACGVQDRRAARAPKQAFRCRKGLVAEAAAQRVASLRELDRLSLRFESSLAPWPGF
jgi:hypothetical protein